MLLPNFLIIGTPKAGTTSLYSYLNQHPDVFMPSVKEPGFLLLDGHTLTGTATHAVEHPLTYAVTTVEHYQSLFDAVTTETAIGEASGSYLSSKRAVDGIKKHIPHARLIASLRNPIDRAYSHYQMWANLGRDSLTFAEAIDAEPLEPVARDEWIPLERRHLRHGFYYQHLKRYLDHFPREQMHIILFDDLNRDPAGVTKATFRFLGIDDGFTPDTSIKLNKTGSPKNRLLHHLLHSRNPIRQTIKTLLPDRISSPLYHRIRNANLRPTPSQLTPEIRAHLIDIFREDILKLQDLIERDLSEWLC